MKKFLLRSTVFLLTFVISLMVASRFLNKDHDNMIMEMGRATLPVITMLWENVEYNPIYGRVSNVDLASVRDNITILGENRSTDFKIRTYGRKLTKITAKVRNSDGTRLIETIELENWKKQEDYVLATLTLKDLIEKGREYVVSIGLEMDGWQEAWYHARVIWDPESLVAQQLAFVRDFHKKLYFREEAKSLIKYLESNASLEDNTSFHHVTIHGSFKQITWGDLKVSEIREPVYTLREISGPYASIGITYAVSTKGSDRDVQYQVQEDYRIKYAPDRTYLLAYDRTMTQIPDEKALYAADKLLLGIGDENVDMMENPSGSVVVFEQANRLFSYQTKEQKIALIFSFYEYGSEDAREEHGEHTVKILGVDDDGNVDFAVWGYQNRGEREGEMGIRICRYNAKINTVSETAFIPWERSFSELDAQLRTLSYLNQDQTLYLYLKRGVYGIDLTTGTVESVMQARTDGCMQASADHQILAWQEPAADGYSNQITLMDLASKEQVVLRGTDQERLRILGFMGQDVIYGIARKEQIDTTIGGREIFPMYRLCIAKADGTILKQYEQEDTYVMGCSIEENQIILDRAKQKEDGSFVETSQDHVTKTQQKKTGKNQVAVVQIDVYEKYVQIKVASKIDPGKVQLLTPKEVIQEGNEDLILELTPPEESYVVYGLQGVDSNFVLVRNAVQRADEISGTVTDEAGNVVWRKGDKNTRNQIMAIRDPDKVGIEASLAVCLETMLRQRGVTTDVAALLERGQSPARILRDNLTESKVMELAGVSLDAILYYVSRDLPVLAVLKSGEAVLITGYNDTQVVIFQPSSGKLAKRSMSDAGKWFEEGGNCFITFFP